MFLIIAATKKKKKRKPVSEQEFLFFSLISGLSVFSSLLLMVLKETTKSCKEPHNSMVACTSKGYLCGPLWRRH